MSIISVTMASYDGPSFCKRKQTLGVDAGSAVEDGVSSGLPSVEARSDAPPEPDEEAGGAAGAAVLLAAAAVITRTEDHHGAATFPPLGRPIWSNGSVLSTHWLGLPSERSAGFPSSMLVASNPASVEAGKPVEEEAEASNAEVVLLVQVDAAHQLEVPDNLIRDRRCSCRAWSLEHVKVHLWHRNTRPCRWRDSLERLTSRGATRSSGGGRGKERSGLMRLRKRKGSNGRRGGGGEQQELPQDGQRRWRGAGGISNDTWHTQKGEEGTVFALEELLAAVPVPVVPTQALHVPRAELTELAGERAVRTALAQQRAGGHVTAGRQLVMTKLLTNISRLQERSHSSGSKVTAAAEKRLQAAPRTAAKNTSNMEIKSRR
ncbi:hypothetical protein EYF80_006582 [Liparis tanakae]|uniref:Uncharacterized protein n=1 Tax=Liparis tanakae TaxID=230148 RepID=A0A4Z2IZ34_9TELE|nr:hypothetical protein EYF80_006582 [Liparis tanakae]